MKAIHKSALKLSLLTTFALGAVAASSCNEETKEAPIATAPQEQSEKLDETPGAAAQTPPVEVIAPDIYPGFKFEILEPTERAKFVAMARTEVCPCPDSQQSLHECLRKQETQCAAANYSAIIIASGIKEKKSQTTILDEVAQYVEGITKTHTFELKETPLKGNPEASVVLVEFADFQCPHCRLVVPVMDEVVKKYGDDIVFYYKHFPLDGHPQAQIAAQAAEAAHRQGKFWEMHALIFENQEALSKAKLRDFAKQIGLDVEQFNQSFESAEVVKAVMAQKSEGESAQLDGTPSLFINGKRYMGEKELEPISAHIDALLAEAKKAPEQGE